MSLALVGIIFIQYLWIRKSVEEKQALIDNEVLQAVTNIDIQLSDVHALAFFSESMNFDFQLSDSLPSLINHHPVSTVIDIDPANPQTNERQIVTRHTVNGDTLIISQTQIENCKEEVDCVTVELRNLEDELRKLEEVKSVFHKIQIETNPNLKDSRLDSVRIADLMKTEFSAYKLDHPSQWGVFDQQENKYVIAPKINSEKFHYQIPLFKTDVISPQRYSLHLNLDDKNGRVWLEIRWMIILSLIFILVILSVFIFSIRLVIKHKKISQIKSDFINNMTHEFKTPLATISLAADSIVHPNIIHDSNRINEFVTIIQHEKTKLNQNVERILEVASLEKGFFELPQDQINLDDILNDAIKNIRLLLNEKNGTISIQTCNDVKVIGGAFHLQNAISNILENAIKYCTENPEIKVRLEKNLTHSILTIQDNGTGLSAKQLEHVFDAFYRVETGNIHTTKGFGLGLTYTKFIIEKMKGEISIQSELDKGTTVTIKIPLA